MSPPLYQQLLCQYIYTEFTGVRRRAYSIKVVHNFKLCVLVKFVGETVCAKLCELAHLHQWVGEIDL